MGCICSKQREASQYVEQNAIEKELKSNKSSKQLCDPSTGDAGRNDTSLLIPNQVAASESTQVSSDEGENVVKNEKVTNMQLQRRETMEVGTGVRTRVQQPKMSRIVSISGAEKGAQVAAGWPSWLAAVAGEAINGWVPRKADSFEKMDKIGQGTYSTVYRARDLESNKLVALKKVRFVNMDPESVRFMAREIIILRRLDHPNVMKLEGLITSRVSGSLYLIFEYMEHDLAGLVATPGVKFTEAQIKCYMQQLLQGLEHCHNRGVLHRDIKGSNLLIDNNSNLKIGDFGLATFFSPHQKQPLTSRVVTLWYRPPELLLGATDYGVSVDLWSTGCILAELYSGKPIMPGRTEVEQLHKIFKICGSPSEEYWKRSKLPHATIFKPQHPYKRRVAETFKEFPSSAMGLLDVLLAVEPENRGTTTSALQSEFFKTDPLPCDPSSLPKYPPSKEFDAKLREEEARRRRAAGGKGRVYDPAKRISRESKAMPAPDANAELQESIQKRKVQANPVSVSEKYHSEVCDSGFPMEPSRGNTLKGFTHSWSMQPRASNLSRNEDAGPDQTFGSVQNHIEPGQESGMHHGTDRLSKFSNSVAVRGASKYDSINGHWPQEHYNPRPESSNRNGQQAEREISNGYASDNRIHYSGPLLPSKGNFDQILKDHEKRIRNAVRKARVDKTRNKKTNGANGQTESLLLCVGNER